MTRTPDPHNPQPGDRYVWWADHDTYAIAAHEGTEVWMRNDGGSHLTVTVKSLCNPDRWSPVLPPLITEDTVLHHWDDSRDHHPEQWGFTSDYQPGGYRTGRKFRASPNDDGSITLREVTS